MKKKLQISFQRKKFHLAPGVEFCQGGIAHNLQLMEFQVVDTHGANGLKRHQHILFAFPGDAEKKVGAKLKTAKSQNPRSTILKSGEIMITVEQSQAFFVDALHPQLKKAFLAGGYNKLGQRKEEIIRYIIWTGGKDQADAVTVRHHSPQKGQELPRWDSSAGFLLKISKIFLKPAF